MEKCNCISYEVEMILEAAPVVEMESSLPLVKGGDGDTPYIGESGNWWIGDIDTGKSATYKLTDQDKKEIAGLIEVGEVGVPTKTSELTNDSGFIDKSVADLENYDTKDIVSSKLGDKVNKVLGKGLSTNDFTDLLKSRLESTMSAEDINAAIGLVQGELDTLVGGDASSAIDSFNEIKTFLATFTDTQDLASILLALKNEITELIPSIEGLATENYVDQKIGDIDTILDSIITLQETI